MIKKIRNMSTFKRMSFITFFAIIIVFLFAYISQFILLRVWATKYEKENIQGQFNEIYEILNSGVSEDKYSSIFKAMNIDVIIYDKLGVVYTSTKEKDDEFKFEFVNKKEIGYDYEFNDDEKIYLNAPININGSEKYIYIIKESDIYADFLENTKPSIIITLVLALGLSISFGIYVSKIFMKKLTKLRETIINIKEKGINNRVEIYNPRDEFDKVNILFNDMMDEVEISINNQKRFVQDASHELKTPLTILKGHIKMLNRWGKDDREVLEKSLEVSLEEIDRLSKLVNDLLTLGKVENSLNGIENIEYLNLNKVVTNVFEDFMLCNDNIKFVDNVPDNIELRILKEHLKQLLIIFIDNSVKYSDSINPVIEVSASIKGKNVELEVKDNGIGIPKEDINKITERFYRVDKSRKYNNSFGIGLSVALEIIKLYGGKLDIDSEEGVGTSIKVLFENK